MKAIVLSRKHRSEIINIISNWRSHEDYTRVENAIGWLTHGSKEVNPFDVFGPQEKELIIEALETHSLGLSAGWRSSEIGARQAI